MSVRYRITSDSALYLAGELIEESANAPSADYAAYGSFEDTLALVDATGTAIVPLPGYVATLRPGEGRFGGAVAVEEGTTNIVPDTDMTSSSWTKQGCTVEKLNETLYGMPVYRVTFPAGRLSRTFFDFGYQDGEWFSGSIYYKFVSGHEAQEVIPAFFFRETDFGTMYKRADFQRVTSWQRIELNHQFSGSGSSMFLLYRSYSDTQTDVVMDFALPQLEQKPFATSFVDGTRSTGSLRYPLNIKEFTLAVWIKVPNDISPFTDNTQGARMFYLYYDDAIPIQTRIGHWSNFSIYIADDKTWTYFQLPSGTVVGDWLFYALRYDGSGKLRMTAYNPRTNASVDAERVTNLDFGTFTRLEFVGNKNTLYDELLVLPYAASEEEVRSLYHQTTVARFHANGDVSIKGELVEGDTGFRYVSDGNLHVNDFVEGVSF